ncbi:helix-turn-helix domain-containing protein [Rhodococcus sp. HNM0563]|uniref:helix-turn-helix domain-containing protein n=1 Tax=unclassified Rhodococcus (in: high G+C Gram-positive bacteria) TaxID=192944 RepID=UPI00146C4C64|nr:MULTISPECIES: helix-turn-helix domain-containing protein [unclassified Rhodococcus (in: high G+C Gram-positive bacteria)]MCK0092573.1 helix-turn-helix domain-containing protein [Rhodococcus sp. F64268]NLU64339.1 helix-turn-helix domain-containing protein [Rhodococcus sp. HNM0563]
MDGEPSIADVVLHPVRLRIIQQLGGRSLTTAELRKELPDITQATLYRHVSALIDAQVVTVVDERRVRGTIERTLALGERMAHVGQDDLDAVGNAELRSAFVSFLGMLGKEFDKFIDSGDRTLRNYLGFGATPLYVDTDDLAEIQAKFNEVLASYRTEKDNAIRITFGTTLIPTPPMES